MVFIELFQRTLMRKKFEKSTLFQCHSPEENSLKAFTN